MKVYFIGAGPGDRELLTIKADRLIRRCPVCIYAGSLVSDDVISLVGDKAKSFDSARMTLEQIVDVMRKARDDGEDVARVHSGDPSIYGAIREQMNELDKLGVEYVTVPGVSSFQAAAAALNLELTAPGKSQTIILTRIAGRTPTPDEQNIKELARSNATLCLFLSIGKLRPMAEDISGHYGADCPATVVYRASWPDQKIVSGTLADIADKVESAGIDKTAMIIVGHALNRKQEASLLYDKNFSHEFRNLHHE